MKKVIKIALSKKSKWDGYTDHTEDNAMKANNRFGLSEKLFLDVSKEIHNSKFIKSLDENYYAHHSLTLRSILSTACVMGFILGWVQAQKKTFKL